MNTNTFSKGSNKKSKKNRTVTEQQSQQTPIATAETTFQPGDRYNELFPPLNESMLSQASNTSHHSSEVCTIFLFSGLYLFAFIESECFIK